MTLTGKSEINARAILLSERLNVKTLREHKVLATHPTVMEIGGGHGVVFRYGVVVLFGVTLDEEAAFIESLEDLLIQPFEVQLTEEVRVLEEMDVQEGFLKDSISVHALSLERFQLIAEILAKSLVLEYYEINVSKNLDMTAPLVASLRRKRFGEFNSKYLLAQIGDSLATLHKMVGSAEVSEKPEILWENPELERFYGRLEEEYEIRERHLVLGRKVELVFRTADTLQDLLQTKRTLRVEWYIVILIVVEILIYLYDLFIKHP